MLQLTGLIAVCIAFVGSFLVLRKNKYGLFLWLIANSGMVVISYLQRNWWTLVFSFGNLLLTFYGIKEWFK